MPIFLAASCRERDAIYFYRDETQVFYRLPWSWRIRTLALSSLLIAVLGLLGLLFLIVCTAISHGVLFWLAIDVLFVGAWFLYGFFLARRITAIARRGERIPLSEMEEAQLRECLAVFHHKENWALYNPMRDLRVGFFLGAITLVTAGIIFPVHQEVGGFFLGFGLDFVEMGLLGVYIRRLKTRRDACLQALTERRNNQQDEKTD